MPAQPTHSSFKTDVLPSRTLHTLGWAFSRTKPQRMKAQSVLFGWAAEASRAPSCLDVKPLQSWSTHPWLPQPVPAAQPPADARCLQWSARVPAAALHFWQKADRGSDAATYCICPRSSHPAAPCCVKRENCTALALKSFCYSSVYSSWFLTILISKWKYYSGAKSPKQPHPNTRAYHHFLFQPLWRKWISKHFSFLTVTPLLGMGTALLPNASCQTAPLYLITPILIPVDEIIVTEMESIPIQRQTGCWTDLLQDPSP